MLFRAYVADTDAENIPIANRFCGKRGATPPAGVGKMYRGGKPIRDGITHAGKKTRQGMLDLRRPDFLVEFFINKRKGKVLCS